ncbi:MAG TPA: hypothetical protein VHD90_07915 [Phototrophicaceae bacterium]|nr:hypothetical protein [Phototrophicaceae bacterium]
MKKAARSLFVQLLLALSLLAILSGAAQASMLCRSDPVVILSNGMTLDLGASISVLPWQVREVHYELHVPVGVSMIAAIRTPAWLTSQETFAVVADQQPKQYEAITTVYTSDGNAQVTADTTLVSLLNIKLGHYSVSGLEGRALALWFHN